MSGGTAVPLLVLAGLLAASLLVAWRDSYLPLSLPPDAELTTPPVEPPEQSSLAEPSRPASTPAPPLPDAGTAQVDPTATPVLAAAPVVDTAPASRPTPTPAPTVASASPSPTATPVRATPTPQPGRVDVSLRLGQPSVAVGQRFTLEVRVHAGPGRLVDAAQVYLDFDPVLLEVSSVQGGGRLPLVLQSKFDNAAGRVDYAAGTLEGDADTSFGLVFVEFVSLAATGPGGTVIGFADLMAPRQTKVVEAGADITGRLDGASIVVQ